MVGLAAEQADGVLTVLVPPEQTAHLRRTIGPEKLLVVGLSAAVDDDRDAARRAAAAFLSQVVARPGSPYAANLIRLGYTEADLVDAAPHAVDAVLGHGRPDDVAAAVQRHLDAGADHVRVNTIAPDFDGGVEQLLRLGGALGGLRAR
jgi:alkanesulfonate monooxygenase SsuD/methylene tetrahydromethanopterin reductase-like flavin-dependent oxidoreductase (luciferase family)